MSLLGVDLGSSSCKAVVFSIDGEPLASAAYGYKTYSPGPGRVEIDADLFWKAAIKAIKEVAQQTVQDPITAMAFSTQGETMIAVDANGNPLRPAFMNADNRGVREIEELCSRIDRKSLYQITGEPAHTMYGISEVMWFKEHERELYKKTAKMVSCEDFMMMKLGFEPLCNYSSCCRTFMLDIRKKKWSEEILCAAGIEREKLGTPVPSGTLAGFLDKGHAKELGLREGTAVVTGGHDCPCSAFGSGAIYPHTAADQAGSYEGITLPVKQPNTSEGAQKVSLNTYCHVLKDQYLSLVLFPAGMCTSWYFSELAGDDFREAKERGISVYQYLEEQVKSFGKEPTGIFFMPHFVGACNPYNDVRSTGTIIGLTPHSSRHMLYKAIYEGIAYEFRMVTDVLERYAGRFDEVLISGGTGRSRFSLELRSALSGKAIKKLACEEAGCLGAAMLAGVATGAYKDEQDAVKKAVRSNEPIMADPEMRKAYEQTYQVYKEIYPSLEKVRSQSSQ